MQFFTTNRQHSIIIDVIKNFVLVYLNITFDSQHA